MDGQEGSCDQPQLRPSLPVRTVPGTNQNFAVEPDIFKVVTDPENLSLADMYSHGTQVEHELQGKGLCREMKVVREDEDIRDSGFPYQLSLPKEVSMDPQSAREKESGLIDTFHRSSSPTAFTNEKDNENSILADSKSKAKNGKLTRETGSALNSAFPNKLQGSENKETGHYLHSFECSSSTDLDNFQIPYLPLNPAYLAAKTHQFLMSEDTGPSSLRRADSSPHTDIPEIAQALSGKREGCSLHRECHPCWKIKEEDGETSMLPSHSSISGYPLTALKHAPRMQFQAPLDFILKTEPLTGGHYTTHFKQIHSTGTALQRDLIPSTSAGPEIWYHQASLNGHSQPAYQNTVYKDQNISQRYYPYSGLFGSDVGTGQVSQYGYGSFPQKICLICGDEASGCHYGVLTCGSCKVFFKRAVEGQHNYLCAGRNDCIVDKLRRKNCPACRLRKCYQAGMVLGGRKCKKFGKLKNLSDLNSLSAHPQVISVPSENHALLPMMCLSIDREIQYSPPLLDILYSIEPDIVYAGYDNTQPDTPNLLLNNLNRLCERQLLSTVRWSKSLPGFRNLHIDDQMTLIQYSWMSMLVFGLGWRSYQHTNGQMLYFAPDLILNEQRMKESVMYELCLAMCRIPQEFIKLQITQDEYLCMKSLLLLNTIPLEGLKNQTQFDDMRASYIKELAKTISLKEKGVVASSQRFYQLTKLMDSMHDLVKKLHLFCLNTFVQSRSMSVEFPEMMSEVITAQLPKILAGMVKHLLFHKR
ncbi:progesterone receptor isoform X2 [Protopterus annectens]|nr:progesterone receptor isoform X2 [Protopterus annectens]